MRTNLEKYKEDFAGRELMDLLQFVSSIVSSLAWPAVVAVLLWLLRPYLKSLVARLEEVTFPGGGSAKFREELDAAREQKDHIVLVEGIRPSSIESVGPTFEEQYFVLANAAPEAAFLQSFNELESGISANLSKVSADKRGSLAKAVDDLHRRQLLDGSWVDLFERIRNLRNLAVHGRGPQRVTPGEAMEYRAMCRLLSDKLREIFDAIPPVD